jgi:hypothetical protein
MIKILTRRGFFRLAAGALASAATPAIAQGLSEQ